MPNDFQAWLCEPIKHRVKNTELCAIYSTHITHCSYTLPNPCGHTYIGTIIHIPTVSTSKKRFICMS